MPSLSAILLAAGASTRMGRQKALIPWAGVTLLEYQLAQLAEVADIREIVVVTGHEPEHIIDLASRAPRTRVAHNADYRTGKVSSIITGLRALSTDAEAIVLLSVDQPRPAAITRALIDEFAASHASIIVPSHEGHRGHPVLFSRALLPELLAINEETQGIRAVLERNVASTRTVELPDPAVNVDLNEPSDL